MSDLKIEDLCPTPFFARFLEGQYAKPLSEQQMKAILGGTTMVTQMAPSDQENVPVDQTPDCEGWLRSLVPQLPSTPRYDFPLGEATTLAYPSDQENVPV